MSKNTALYHFVILTMLLSACEIFEKDEPKPELSPIPQISLENFELIVNETIGQPDTFRVTLSYQDGDRNLGLTEENYWNDTIFQEFYYLTHSGDTIADKNEDVIEFQDVENTEYNRDDWRIDPTNMEDTLRVVYNENFYNYYLTLYLKRDNNWIDLKELTGIPTGFARFSETWITDSEQLTNYILRFYPETTCNGTVVFRSHNRFNLIFDENTELKFSVFIKDRALNKSNLVESPVFPFRNYKMIE